MIYAILLIILAASSAPVGPLRPGNAPAALHFACDPAWAALFTPPHPVAGTYTACSTSAPLDDVVADPDGVRYGAVEALDPLDAFGTAGPYDRSALARLYGGRRARVARGWRQTDHEFESVTLVSPYPDPALMRLMPGTLAIRYTLRSIDP